MFSLPTGLILLGMVVACQTLAIPTPLPPQCPNYEHHSRTMHGKNSTSGKHALPFQRPTTECRTYYSEEVEEALERLRPKIKDPDLYRLLENSYPNTLDTMVKWKGFAWKNQTLKDEGGFTDEDLAFVITGDMYVLYMETLNRDPPMLIYVEAMPCGYVIPRIRYSLIRLFSGPQNPPNLSRPSFAASSTLNHATYSSRPTVTLSNPYQNPKSPGPRTAPMVATISISSMIVQKLLIANGSSTRWRVSCRYRQSTIM